MAAERVVVAGGSGFIGRALVRELRAAGYDVVILTRSETARTGVFSDRVRAAVWDGRTAGDWVRDVDGALAVVNLAGDDLARGRWTKAKKDRILNSRTRPGAALVEAFRRTGTKPRVFIQASAVGFYGSPGEADIDERAAAGEGFLADVVRDWEGSTGDIERLGVRRAVIRSGLVLGRGGGVWPNLVRPFRFFVGGPLGSGRQWFSWIALEDEVRAIRFLIERQGLAGPFNLTAPQPLRERDLCRLIGRAMRRPCGIPLPASALRLLFGEKARDTLLVSQKVRPRRLLEAGFTFRFPEAGAAVAALVRSGSRAGSPAG